MEISRGCAKNLETSRHSKTWIDFRTKIEKNIRNEWEYLRGDLYQKTKDQIKRINRLEQQQKKLQIRTRTRHLYGGYFTTRC